MAAVLRTVDAAPDQRELPHSNEAEQSVLGGLLLDNSRWRDAAALLREDDFFRQEHGAIFAAISAIVGSGCPADVITVFEYLKVRGRGHASGGLAYLNALAQSVPSASNLRRYSEIVRDQSILRRVMAICESAANDASNARGKPPVQILTDLSEKLSVLAGLANAHSVSSGVDAAELLEREMVEPGFICEPFIAEGLTLLAGPPKTGKTTLARQLMHAVNHGTNFLGEQCQLADVLFLSLEEGARLMKKKLRAMQIESEQFRGVRMEFEWPQAAEGAERIRDWLKARKSDRPALVLIDSLARFRLPPSAKANAFSEDYAAVKRLADLCKEFPGLSIVVLHHTTKAIHDDPVAMISGTFGLSAGVDSYLIMLRQSQAYRLHAGGRLWDRDVHDYSIARDAGRWNLNGEWDEAVFSMPPKQRAILDLLAEGAKTNRALEEETGQSASSTSHMLKVLLGKGLVARVANGWELVR